MREHRFALFVAVALACYGLASATEDKPRKQKHEPDSKHSEKKKEELRKPEPRKEPHKKKPNPEPPKKEEPRKQPQKEEPKKAPLKKEESRKEELQKKEPKAVEPQRSEAVDANLVSLDWLVGEWHDLGTEKGLKVSNVFRWNSTGTFLIRSYRVEDGDKVTRQGTQIIGWDPVNKRIRSWIFGNEGGFAEGFWSVEKDGWMATLSGSMPDGTPAVVTQILKRSGENLMTSQLVGEEIAGQRQPLKELVKMKRIVAEDRN